MKKTALICVAMAFGVGCLLTSTWGQVDQVGNSSPFKGQVVVITSKSNSGFGAALRKPVIKKLGNSEFLVGEGIESGSTNNWHNGASCGWRSTTFPNSLNSLIPMMSRRLQRHPTHRLHGSGNAKPLVLAALFCSLAPPTLEWGHGHNCVHGLLLPGDGLRPIGDILHVSRSVDEKAPCSLAVGDQHVQCSI